MLDNLILMFIVLGVISATGSITIKDLTIFGILKLKNLSFICKSILTCIYKGDLLQSKELARAGKHYYKKSKQLKRIVKSKEEI